MNSYQRFSMLTATLLIMFICAPVCPRFAARALPPWQHAEQASDEVPGNIISPESIQQLIAEIMRHSATFKAQCGKINGAAQVKIVIKILPCLPDGVKALSMIKKFQNGKMRIEMMFVPQLNIRYV